MINYGIGTTANNIVSLESLGIDPPTNPGIPDYGRYIEVGNVTKKGIGYLMTTWRFDWVSAAGVAALRTYIPIKSASVYIRTLNEDNTYSVYSATANWQKKLPPKVGELNDFVLEFVAMEAV